MEQCRMESLRQAAGDLAQYREPLCFELTGMSFRVWMLDGEYTLAFLSEKTASWTAHDAPCETGYECLKLKDQLYLVNLEPSQSVPGLGMVMDLNTGFSALQYPGESEPVLGAVSLEGKTDAFYSLTSSALVGHTILWRCSPQSLFGQTFERKDSFHITAVDASGTARTLRYAARYFQLREDVFLTASASENGREALLMLADLNAVRAAGLSRLNGPAVSQEAPALLFSAYGAFLPVDESVEAAIAGDDKRKYKTRIVGKPLVNPVTRQPIPAGLKQYVQPCTGELAGRFLDMRLDGQEPVLIRFLDAATLEWAYQGKPFQLETYEATKGDDAVYMIVCHPRLKEPASCVTLVWDADTRLVTAILAWEHLDRAYPRMVVSRALFGAENRKGEPLPALRHHYTDELIGKRFIWHYTANDDVLHICFDQTHFRLGAANVTLAPNPSQDALANYQRLLKRHAQYPYYEEMVYYIKIKDGLYLYSVIEYAMCRLLNNQGGGELLALVNTARTRYTGRTFGLDAQEKPGHDIIGAPGCPGDIPDEVESLPCPIYNV